MASTKQAVLISFRRLESKKDKLRNQMDLDSSRLMMKRLTEDLILHVISTRSIMRASAVVTVDCGKVAAILFFCRLSRNQGFGSFNDAYRKQRLR